jgi:peptidoglycan/xylan/chitin deacetylase (PgdA/CDA1 family)
MSENLQYHVLLYHGVHADDLPDGPKNSSGKHISRRRFDAQMEDLAANHPVVSMEEIAAAYRGEFDLPQDAVAVTFDDGFLNNYTEAWPVLEKHGIPATIYIATGFIGTGRMIWTDQLETSILGTSRSDLRVNIDGENHCFELSDDIARAQSFLKIKEYCKRQATAKKDELIERICLELTVEFVPTHPLYAFMNWDQVREMNHSTLVSFGAHTIDHISLAKCPPEVMLKQIDTSIAKVGQELGEPCTLFSYPEGQENDYNIDVINHLKSLGFNLSPSAIDGSNSFPETNPFDIRRMMVGFEGRPYPFGNL